MALIDEVKDFCRTDEDLTKYIDGAKIYLKNAGIKEDESNALYVQAISFLVAHWYDNRLPIGTKTEYLEFSLKSIVLQLKYGGDSNK